MTTKRNAKCTKTVADNVVRFTFANEKVLTFDPMKVTPEIGTSLMLHGASQKIGDSFAGSDTVDEAYEEAAEVLEQLYAGQWKAARAVGEPRTGLLVEALARISGKDGATCKLAVETMADEARKALRNDPRIKQAIAEINLERAKKAVTEETAGVDIAGLF